MIRGGSPDDPKNTWSVLPDWSPLGNPDWKLGSGPGAIAQYKQHLKDLEDYWESETERLSGGPGNQDLVREPELEKVDKPDVNPDVELVFNKAVLTPEDKRKVLDLGVIEVGDILVLKKSDFGDIDSGTVDRLIAAAAIFVTHGGKPWVPAGAIHP